MVQRHRQRQRQCQRPASSSASTSTSASYCELGFSAAADLGQQKKAIVLTGASIPERFRDSDAHFNVGLAMGAL